MGETSPPKEVGQMDREAILPTGGRAKRGIFSRKCSTPMARCYPGDPIYQGNGKIESDGPTIMGILVEKGTVANGTDDLPEPTQGLTQEASG
jgi:hypothetical protein